MVNIYQNKHENLDQVKRLSVMLNWNENYVFMLNVIKFEISSSTYIHSFTTAFSCIQMERHGKAARFSHTLFKCTKMCLSSILVWYLY